MRRSERAETLLGDAVRHVCEPLFVLKTLVDFYIRRFLRSKCLAQPPKEGRVKLWKLIFMLPSCDRELLILRKISNLRLLPTNKYAFLNEGHLVAVQMVVEKLSGREPP